MLRVCTARGAGSAPPRQPQDHCQGSPWQPAIGFTLKPSDPSITTGPQPPCRHLSDRLRLPEMPAPTAHMPATTSGGAPHGRDAGRPGQWSRAPQVSLRCNGLLLPAHAGTWPLAEGFSLGLETEALYHVWAEGRRWSGSNGAGRGGRRGGFLRLRARPWNLLHIV